MCGSSKFESASATIFIKDLHTHLQHCQSYFCSQFAPQTQLISDSPNTWYLLAWLMQQETTYEVLLWQRRQPWTCVGDCAVCWWGGSGVPSSTSSSFSWSSDLIIGGMWCACTYTSVFLWMRSVPVVCDIIWYLWATISQSGHICDRCRNIA